MKYIRKRDGADVSDQFPLKPDWAQFYLIHWFRDGSNIIVYTP